MIDPKKLTDDELAACAKEYYERVHRCSECGGKMKTWHIHICDEDGGANVLINSPAGRALCATQ